MLLNNYYYYLSEFLAEVKCYNNIRNVRKFTKFVYYKGNIKFDDIYDVFE